MLSSLGQKLARELEFPAQVNEGFFYGRIGDFPVCIHEFPNRQLLLCLAAKPGPAGGEQPEKEELRRRLPAGRQLSVTEVKPFEWRIAVAERSFTKTLLLLQELFRALQETLTDLGFVPCCARCGAEEELSIYQCGERMAVFCSGCAAEAEEKLGQAAVQVQQKKTSLGKGILGAVIGAALGGVVWVLIYRVGYIAAVGGLALVFGALKGYELLGGRLDKKGAAASVAVSVLMMFAAMMVSYGWELYDIYAADGFTFLDCVMAAPTAVFHFPDVGASFAMECVIGLLFIGLGGFSTIRAAYRKHNPSFAFRKLL